MPRENSFSDSDGRSLTPDLEEGSNAAASIPLKPSTYDRIPHERPSADVADAPGTQSAPGRLSTAYPGSARSAPEAMDRTKFITPTQRFRETVRKVMAIRRTSYVISRGGVGAEPGIDPRRDSALLNYGHIHQKCIIEVADYSATRSSFGKMTNHEFIRLINDPSAGQREPWVKVRWINVGGISWDVISALALKYSAYEVAEAVCRPVFTRALRYPSFGPGGRHPLPPQLAFEGGLLPATLVHPRALPQPSGR